MYFAGKSVHLIVPPIRQFAFKIKYSKKVIAVVISQ